jgi:hypothetical protein
LVKAYSIVGWKTDGNGEPVVQAKTMDGPPHEFKFAIHEDEEGNFSFDLVRHYVDPDSVAAFPRSISWEEGNG